MDLLVQAIEVHRVQAGPMGLPDGDHVPAWWLLAEGHIAVGHVGSHGRLVESHRVAPGEWLDVASAWTAASGIETAVCNTEVTLWAIPLDALVRCCALDPDFVHAMGRVMADRVRQLTEARHELATKDVLSRVASWLWRQLPAPASDMTSFRLREQKRSIARELVMAQETLSRCLRRLADLGCIEISGYQITILDLNGLRTVARVRDVPVEGWNTEVSRPCQMPCSPSASVLCAVA